MARIRTIKPEFPQSESIGRVSRDARLLFVELWTICDDSGRTRAASRMLASLLFPYDDDAPGLIDDWLAELEREGCIDRYVVDGHSYIQIRNWLNHQKIDKPSQSKIPQFDEQYRILANPRERSSEDQGPRTKEGKGENQEIPSLRSDSSAGADGNDSSIKKNERLRQITIEAIETFNATLGQPNGSLSNVKAQVGSDTRLKQVRRCLKVASEICQDQFASPLITKTFWEAYWAECKTDDFRAGRISGGKGHEGWKSSFEYLTRPDVMLAVFDKAVGT